MRLEMAIELLSRCGFIEAACRDARCSKSTFYDFRRRYRDFAKEVDEAARRATMRRPRQGGRAQAGTRPEPARFERAMGFLSRHGSGARRISKKKGRRGWREDSGARPDTIRRLEKAIGFLARYGFVEVSCQKAHCSKGKFYEFMSRYDDFVREAVASAKRAG